jgi:hypothetical protein
VFLIFVIPTRVARTTSRLLTKHPIRCLRVVSYYKTSALSASRSLVQITQPHKKPRGKQLTDAQKAENQVISHRRVRIEHIICRVMRCRIIKDTIRLWKDTARDLVMAICCGLHNFRVRLHPWPAYQ